MMTGLPLDEALREAESAGLTLTVRFTQAPRRTRDDAQPADLVARVLRRDGDVLICARFSEPRLHA